jgi:[ribosomal protein S18]-alanine N-acetyltransferase
MSLEIRVLSPEWERPLASFFSSTGRAAEDLFHPHPFTDEQAKLLTHYSGKDLYYLFVDGVDILAYGMLRGWDEGYDVPSLGIVVHPDARGQGVGEVFMHFLHSAARKKGARKIMLKVYKENAAAYKLYLKLGYQFDGEEQKGQLVGRLLL